MDINLGPQSGPEAYKVAQQKVADYNEKHNRELAKIDITETGDVIVAICDDFCRRVHETVPQAGDIVLVDATSNLDRHDTKLFHLICPTPVGGLPLGTLIVSREDEDTLDSALALYESILPEKAFFGRGIKVGPKIFMTDDATAERNALLKKWPDATLLLCVFHLLQAFWRWLWESKHKIEKEDRPLIFIAFREVLYATTEIEFKKKEKALLRHKSVRKYQNLAKHLKEDILPRKDEWSLITRFKNSYSTNNVNTTNYAEVSFRITKENQFGRVKAYSFAELLEIVLDDSEYYAKRCIDIGNNRTSQFYNQKSRYLPKNTSIDASKISKLGNGVPNSFLVPSEFEDGKFYEVNMDLRVCECRQGMLRGPCKHKQIVAANFEIATPDVIPSSDSMTDCKLRAFYHFVGTGVHKDINWYRPLTCADEMEAPTDGFNNCDIFNFMRVAQDETVAESHDDEDEYFVPEDEVQHSEEVDTEDEQSDDDDFRPDYMAYDSDGEMITEEPSVENLSVEQILEYFELNLQKFSENVKSRLLNEFDYYRKPVARFSKQLDTLQKSTPGMFSKALYGFCDDVNFSAKKGQKTGRYIGINNTHKARRVYKIRGSGSAPKGRPSKSTRPREKSDEPTSTILPSKVRKTKHPHSLSNAVAAIRVAEKKH